MRTRRDWVVWSRARPAKGDCKLRGFEQEGKIVFQGKLKRKKKGQGRVETIDETENDAQRTKLKEVGVPAGRKDGGSAGMWKPS